MFLHSTVVKGGQRFHEGGGADASRVTSHGALVLGRGEWLVQPALPPPGSALPSGGWLAGSAHIRHKG